MLVGGRIWLAPACQWRRQGFLSAAPCLEGDGAPLYLSMQIACSLEGFGQHVGILGPLGDNGKISTCRGKGSNPGPRDHHSRALTTQLQPPYYNSDTIRCRGGKHRDFDYIQRQEGKGECSDRGKDITRVILATKLGKQEEQMVY